MKKYTTLCLAILFAVMGYAQEQIKVHYISQTSFEIDENEKRDEFTEALEKAMKEIHEYELIIDGDESTFKKVEKIKNDAPSNGVSISFGLSNSNLYKNVAENIYITSTSFDGYVEKDKLEKYDWQLTREKDKILNYEVRKAILQDSTSTTVAWYAPKLNFKTGPDVYWGLPGLILKVEILHKGEGNERTYYLADAIEMVEESTPLSAPSNGKIVSKEKIEQLREERNQYYKELRSRGVDTSD